MVRDPSYATLIAWLVIVHQPETLEDRALKNYYRHFKQASLQRHLNHFKSKKRLHGNKKDMVSKYLYIRDLVTKDVGSLFQPARAVWLPPPLTPTSETTCP